MPSKDFVRQIDGYGLTTATILYRMPDHRHLLQTFVWQNYDIAPEFPELKHFLDFWRRELDGPLHSVTVAHSRLLRPAQFRNVDGELTIH
ncbi:usg protein [Chelatococcus sp. GCM10030263]|uniref:usg protein n=1 Tax=Chelatococcus sp. GCM10030263 TaxID=3273387 RepID=UPI0036129403